MNDYKSTPGVLKQQNGDIPVNIVKLRQQYSVRVGRQSVGITEDQYYDILNGNQTEVPPLVGTVVAVRRRGGRRRTRRHRKRRSTRRKSN